MARKRAMRLPAVVGLATCCCLSVFLDSDAAPAPTRALFSPQTLAAMSPGARLPWLMPAETSELPDVQMSRLRQELFTWLLPLVRARWIDGDLPSLLSYPPVAEGLGDIERNAVWAQYSVADTRVLVADRVSRLSLQLRPERSAEWLLPCNTVRKADRRDAVEPWQDLPPDTQATLRTAWEQCVNEDVVTEPPGPSAYCGIPALVGRAEIVMPMTGAPTGARVAVLCDGECIGILVDKQANLAFVSGVRQVVPAPCAPDVKPLPGGGAVYEETGVYRDSEGLFVNARDEAAFGVVRVISTGAPLVPAGASRLFVLPVAGEAWPDIAWHTCECALFADALYEQASHCVSLMVGLAWSPTGTAVEGLTDADARAELAEFDEARAWWEARPWPQSCIESTAKLRTFVAEAAALAQEFTSTPGPQRAGLAPRLDDLWQRSRGDQTAATCLAALGATMRHDSDTDLLRAW